MQELNQNEIESVSGGLVFLAPALVEAAGIAAAAFGAYQAGKVLGSDGIQFLRASGR
jgi:lactobin A/cerein 7B family class IIb bacteriocin